MLCRTRHLFLLMALLAVGCNQGGTTASNAPATTSGTGTTGSNAAPAPATAPAGERLTLEAYNAGVNKAMESLGQLGTGAPAFQKEIQGMDKSNPEAIKQKTVEFVDKMRGKYDSVVADLRALRPPADLDNFHKTFVDGMAELGTTLIDMGAAAGKMDKAAIDAAKAKGQEIQLRVFPEIEKAATDAGYKMGPKGLEKAGATGAATAGTAGTGGPTAGTGGG